MDPALLKDRESFKKKAKATPAVKKTAKTKNAKVPTKNEREKKMPVSIAPKIDFATDKTMPETSQYRFGVLAKIVSHMRKRHLNGDDHSLTLDDILDESNQLDVGHSIKKWLGTEALKNNEKIEVSSDGLHFRYKPVYKIKDGKSLMRLLKKHDLKGLGGILLDDVQDSLPNCDNILKRLDKEIIYVERPSDKKKVLFYNDSNVNFNIDEEFKKLWQTIPIPDDDKIKEYLDNEGVVSSKAPKKPIFNVSTANLNIDEEFKKLWRTIPIEGVDDDKIKEYLNKEGVVSSKAPKKLIFKRNVAVPKKRQSQKPRDNEHLSDVLETYDDNCMEIKSNNSRK